jgi:hypothetical protein
MSTEFFSTMAEIEAEAAKAKFLEGSHPELYEKYFKKATVILGQIKKMNEDIKKDLKKKSQTQLPKKSKRGPGATQK